MTYSLGMILKKKNEKVVAIIQARMGSKRFPGKMMAKLGGYPVLEWVVSRVSKSKKIDQLVVATTTSNKDDQITEYSKRLGVEFYRGSESNVLNRFVCASKKYEADLVVRICADNPFVDAAEIDRLIDFYNKNQCDYACNHRDEFSCQYPDGFGGEILSFDLLKKIELTVNDEAEREHVTLHLYNNQSSYELKGVPCIPELSFPQLKFDIDTYSDLEKLNNYLEDGVSINSLAEDIVNAARNKERNGK